jgi:serine/threonine protein kinase/class 3 adenylate cyclase/Tfp pilus assembly protein PilF
MAAPAAQQMVLLFTDVVGSVELKTRFGAAAYAELIARHDAIFREIVETTAGSEIVKDTGDGFLARFASAHDAVSAGLRFQFGLLREPWEPEPLRVRVGVHIGEVMELAEDVDGRPKLVGLAADIAARLMDLALPGQILMTRGAFDEARQHVREHPPVRDGEHGPPRLKWMAHGAYLFKGTDEPIDVFEVGAVGVAPAKIPPSGGKARRVVPADEEELMGWRPAVGLDVPGREGWRLERRLGEGGFGEVWLARQRAERQQRVFKFCFDAERVRSLKREATLFRLLREALGDRDDIAKLYDVHIESPPYFLESEFTALGSLSDWVEREGGVDRLTLDARLALLARTCDAVAAAHSVGILHKDIKPSNVLVYADQWGVLRPRLADFGIGALTDPTQLRRRDITLAGFTETVSAEAMSSMSGTRMYAPPETLAGRPFTIQGDVYALGVIVYQMVVGDLTQPLAGGWERQVDDPLLREDIAACVDGDPARRPSGAAALAERIRTLPGRRQARAREEEARRRARRREKLTRVALAAAVVLAVLLSLVGYSLYRERDLRLAATEAKTAAETAQKSEAKQRKKAESEAAKATAVNRFLRRMLSSVDPLQAEGRDITVYELLDSAARDVAYDFAEQPEVEASVRDTLGRSYTAIGRYDDAKTQLEQALTMRRALHDGDDAEVAETLLQLGGLQRELADYDAAKRSLDEALEMRNRLFGARSPEVADVLAELVVWHIAKAEYDAAEELCRRELSIRRETLGPEHRDTADAMVQLSWILFELSKFDETETLLRDALAIKTKLFGEHHPAVAGALNNLARLFAARNQLDDAATYYERALEINREAYGDTHPAVAINLFNLGQLHAKRADFAKAEEYFRAAMEIDRKILGEAHPLVAADLNNLGALRYRTGDPDGAEELFKQALAIKRKTLGDNHPEVAADLNNLAVIASSREDYAGAEALCREAWAINQKAYGAESPPAATNMENIAKALRGQGDFARALPLQEEALAIKRKVFGDTHPEVAVSLESYAEALMQSGDFSAAERAARECYEIRQAALPDGDWATAHSGGVVGRCLVKLERYADAEPLLLAEVDATRREFGDAHQRTQTALQHLCELYEAWGKPESAAKWEAMIPTTQAGDTTSKAGVP